MPAFVSDLGASSLLLAQVWTFHNRVALVVGVTDKSAPIQDAPKLQRLAQVLADMLGGEEAVVKHEMVRLQNWG